MRAPRRIIPNLPDVFLRRMFQFLSYRELCMAECVCRRWQSIVLALMRRNIHEITIEQFGASQLSAHQVVPLRRLTVTCPADAFDFQAGIIRRSRLSLVRLTTDVQFLANLQYVYVNKDERRKYFSNVEELWLLVISCTDDVIERFLHIEEMLFSEITKLTLQVHVLRGLCKNVATVVRAFSLRHPKASIHLELHADDSSLILSQMDELHAISIDRIKIICTDFDLPRLRLDQLYEIMRKRELLAKNIALRDWTLIVNGCTPLIAHPIDTFRISSCTIDSVDDLIKSIQITIKQQTTADGKKRVKRSKTVAAVELEKTDPSKKIVRRVVKKRKKPFIKKLEIAGQCTLRGLQFLQNKAHVELEKRLRTAAPDLVVDCEDIYYCW
ncbi:hypothetical protein Y032_0098g3071 [Ancylostoma ceylanicum]|uniref:F-box domain-containing protein n=1 Tax=Ancylostoma ceylanicum TaxID=53326 RepID=A0A016TJ14_9BILA|nr:hypothetical protein Y032_0098g3071 [Ancylostoma ceylanicum]